MRKDFRCQFVLTCAAGAGEVEGRAELCRFKRSTEQQHALRVCI